MSNDSKARKRKYPEIKPVRATPQDAAATQRIMGRLMGRETLPPVQETRATSEPTPLRESEPLQLSQPLPKSEPVRKITPPENRSALLKNGPVRKTTPLQISPGVQLLPSDAPHLRFPYEVLDHLLKGMKPGPRVLLERLYRLSAGWDSEECVVSLGKLREHCEIEETQIRKHLVWLEERGFIRRLENVIGGRDLSIRGIRFRVLLPRIPLGKTTPLGKNEPLGKSEPNKETHIKETHTNTDDRLAPGVGVRSRFSLAECRAYAENLRTTGQGITNPGGYATKVHRTGEADELIAAFLAPATAQASVDVSLCPDCHGTGFRPHESGQGVIKCKHEHLTPTPAD